MHSVRLSPVRFEDEMTEQYQLYSQIAVRIELNNVQLTFSSTRWEEWKFSWKAWLERMISRELATRRCGPRWKQFVCQFSLTSTCILVADDICEDTWSLPKRAGVTTRHKLELAAFICPRIFSISFIWLKVLFPNAENNTYQFEYFPVFYTWKGV